MNLDDLMEVWRSQDASPLHGVNETLVRLSLRQDEAKLQRAATLVEMVHLRHHRVDRRRHGETLLHHDRPATTMCCPVGTTPSRSSAQPPPCSGSA